MNKNLRFIPAHAGNTYHLIDAPDCPTVHPRPRGEHVIIIPGMLVNIRFIPAHAGNTRR